MRPSSPRPWEDRCPARFVWSRAPSEPSVWGDDVGASVDTESKHPASEAWRGGGGGGCVSVAGTPQPEQRGSPRTGSQEWLVSLRTFEVLSSYVHLAWHLARVSAEQSQP